MPNYWLKYSNVGLYTQGLKLLSGWHLLKAYCLPEQAMWFWKMPEYVMQYRNHHILCQNQAVCCCCSRSTTVVLACDQASLPDPAFSDVKESDTGSYVCNSSYIFLMFNGSVSSNDLQGSLLHSFHSYNYYIIISFILIFTHLFKSVAFVHEHGTWKADKKIISQHKKWWKGPELL